MQPPPPQKKNKKKKEFNTSGKDTHHVNIRQTSVLMSITTWLNMAECVRWMALWRSFCKNRQIQVQAWKWHLSAKNCIHKSWNSDKVHCGSKKTHYRPNMKMANYGSERVTWNDERWCWKCGNAPLKSSRVDASWTTCWPPLCYKKKANWTGQRERGGTSTKTQRCIGKGKK